jgi:hypothetical protein
MLFHSLASDTTVHDKEQYTMLRHFGKYWKGRMMQACSLVANIMVDKKQVVHLLHGSCCLLSRVCLLLNTASSNHNTQTPHVLLCPDYESHPLASIYPE